MARIRFTEGKQTWSRNPEDLLAFFSYEEARDTEDKFKNQDAFLAVANLINTFRDLIIEIIFSIERPSQARNKGIVIPTIERISSIKDLCLKIAEYFETVHQDQQAIILREKLAQLQNEAAVLLFFYAFRVRNVVDKSQDIKFDSIGELKN